MRVERFFLFVFFRGLGFGFTLGWWGSWVGFFVFFVGRVLIVWCLRFCLGEVRAE